MKVASARLSQMEMCKGDAEFEEVRTERDKLQAQLEEVIQKVIVVTFSRSQKKPTYFTILILLATGRC